MIDSQMTLSKKLSVSLLLVTALVMSIGAWAESITDVAGRSIEVPKKVERILLGEGRLFHAVALLEGQQPFSRIVGWQGDFRKLDPQTYTIYKAKFPEIDQIPLIGNTSADTINSERALTLNPDIAIFSLSGHGPGLDSELFSQLNKAGIPVVFVDFRTSPLKNTIPSMRLLGKVLHREQQAERYIQFYEQNVKKVTDVTGKIAVDQQPTVFLELKAGTSDECCSSPGNGNMGDFIDLAGGKNIAKGLLPGALGTINLEKVLAADPDVYIASGGQAPGSKAPGVKFGAQVTPEMARDTLHNVLERKGIHSLKAVQAGNSYGIWHSFYNSPYNVLAIQAFAKWLYPEQFKDLDPQQTMQQMYQQFLAVEPTGTYWVSSKNSR